MPVQKLIDGKYVDGHLAVVPEKAAKCPTCGSPDPKLHPAMQFEGEVQICDDAFHASYGR